jgi:drug/metabolite transporter (DMT)-like permease
MIITSSLCWGWYTGAAARLAIKYGALRLTLWVMLTGTLLMIPLFLPSMLHQDWLSVPFAGWAGFAYCTFLSIVYSYLIWSFALRHIGVSRTAVYSNLTPMVALFGGWLLLGERPALAQFAGMALILGGILIVRMGKPMVLFADASMRMAGIVRPKPR